MERPWCGSKCWLCAVTTGTEIGSEQWCGVSVSSVLAVTDSFSQVNEICGVVFSDSDCGFVKQQTFPFSGERNATVALE